ncbi:DUF1772 domain-containing protein [Rhodococcus sp. p52]|uniref:DUF1772 domain-containing protein n=1 Tax=Rhodococcus sp. p52 TaxID=935199 RepID=UPI00051A67BB|nr:DUF1772 domain-containing protein [Rhodococcus sp. p52]AOD22368.1 DUF1772 domain-containing protein [Rhodococcus sp. p52]
MTALRVTNSRSDTLRTVVSAAYSWVALIAFGGVLAETIILYPNIFHAPPDSLDLAVRFFSQTGPADFFPPMGALTVALGLAALIVVRRDRAARRWVLASLTVLLLGEFAFSALYFWPRNTIMFDEGIAVHSAETLRRVATEFVTGHRVRLAMSALTATLAFGALRRVLISSALARAAREQAAHDVRMPPAPSAR